jgi:tetratricopeptide (TPR) repeat protein
MPIADHVRLLRDGVLLPLPQLLAVDAESPIYNEGHRQSLFYAQAWALIHYLSLRQEPGRPFQLRRFLQALADGRPTDEAFQDTIGRAYPKLEAELRAYVANRVYPVISFRMEAPRAAERFTVTALSPADTEVHLGKLLLHVNRLDDAEVLFERARSLDATLPGPHEALGFLALRRGQVAAALEHLAEAFRRDSRSHLAHYAYADALSRQRPDGRFSPDQARAILASARAAAALEPRFLPARHLLARVYLTLAGEAEVAEGAREMADARAAFPGDMRIALTLGNLQFQQRDYDAASATLRTVTVSPDATLRAQAEYLLARIAEASGSQPGLLPASSSPEYGR